MAGLLTFLGVISVLCTLQWPTSVSGNVRLSRETDAPPPVDCLLSSWGKWTECDPCTKQMYRSRSIVKIGQFGGKPCLSNLGESQLCKPDKVCEEKPIDCGNDYECETGKCIKIRLKCNKDNDCGDFSDENDCENERPVCRDDIEVSELARTAGGGVNILGMDAKANSFDNEQFNGICNRIRDGTTKTYWRLPWNVAALTFRTVADKDFTTETYTDSAAVVEKILVEKTNTFEGSLSFKFTPTEIVKKLAKKDNGGDKVAIEKAGDSKGPEVGGKDFTIGGAFSINKSKKENVDMLKEYKLVENKVFLRLSGKVQLATFQMKTRGVFMSQTFIDDVNYLPSSYDKAEYFAFLETYGTHYAVSGSIGGKYDLVYVLDTVALTKNDVTTTDVQDCLGYNLGLNVDGPGITGKIGFNNPKCSRNFGNNEQRPEKSALIDNVVSFVEGGSSAFAAKLNAKLKKEETINIADFVDWAASLEDHPVIIKQKSSPIYTLIPVDMKEAYNKSRNLEKAINDYIDEYSSCKCQPCKNGGTLMVVDGECWCKCPHRFTGVACQTLRSQLYDKLKISGSTEASTAIDGNWSCWSDSSSCIKDEKTQTRQCNNPAPQNSGKPCGGERLRKTLC